MIRAIGAGFRKRARLFMAASSAAVCLCSCQTPQAPPAKVEPPTPIVEAKPKPVVEPSPEPAAPIVEPKAEPPRFAGLPKQAKRLGATAKRILDDRWQVTLGERVLTLTEKSRKADLDDTVLFLNEPFKRRKGFFALSDSDFRYTLIPAFAPIEGTLRSEVIVIDPGHGGSERGARNDSLGLLEKDLTLDVSYRLKTLLEELGYKVLLTRYDDRLVPLEERTKIANRSNAGIFVSVHFNAALNLEAIGLETYVLTPPGAASTNDQEPGLDAQAWPGNAFDLLNFDLGFQIHKRLIDDLQRTDRGLKRARFKVLKGLECPGILVECGFLSHAKEALLVNTPVYRQKLAESLAKSLDDFSKAHGGDAGS